MSGTNTVRIDPVATPAAATAPAIEPALFRAGRDPDDTAGQLIDRVAFAIAVERRTAAASPETLDQLRNEATVALTNFAFRHLHNSVAEIREQAIAEHRVTLRKPPGFAALLLASMIGSAIVATAVLWLQAHPELVAQFIG